MTNFVAATNLLDMLDGEMSAAEKNDCHYYDILGDISIAMVEYRIAHQLNQKQLAELLGVSQTMVSKYESGSYNISVKALNDLCFKLGLSLSVALSAQPVQSSIITSEMNNPSNPDMSVA